MRRPELKLPFWVISVRRVDGFDVRLRIDSEQIENIRMQYTHVHLGLSMDSAI
jgi:hypothetical protein